MAEIVLPEPYAEDVRGKPVSPQVWAKWQRIGRIWGAQRARERMYQALNPKA